MISNDPGNTKIANKEEQPNKLGFVSWCLQEPISDRGISMLEKNGEEEEGTVLSQQHNVGGVFQHPLALGSASVSRSREHSALQRQWVLWELQQHRQHRLLLAAGREAKKNKGGGF